MEKLMRPVSGFLVLITSIFLVAGGIVCFALNQGGDQPLLIVLGVICLALAFFLLKGHYDHQALEPGAGLYFLRALCWYRQGLRNGLLWVTPLFARTRVIPALPEPERPGIKGQRQDGESRGDRGGHRLAGERYVQGQLRGSGLSAVCKHSKRGGGSAPGVLLSL